MTGRGARGGRGTRVAKPKPKPETLAEMAWRILTGKPKPTVTEEQNGDTDK
jgi:hypothetical protein